jgi:hypothetical protein
MHDGGSAGLEVSAAVAAVVGEQWAAFGEPGTWWTGSERVAIAEVARAARRQMPGSGPAPVPGQVAEQISGVAQRAAALIASAPHRIDRTVVDGFEADGLGRVAYTEIVGIVARVVALDTATLGLGAGLAPVPSPRSGDPTRETVARARRRSAYVPMDGGAGPTTALSSVPSENRAQEQLHGALYLSYAEMGDYRIVKGLTRVQMETVAARTSLLNECFF